MSAEQNREVIRRWAAAGDQRDLDAFDSLFTSDTIDHVSGNTGVLWWKEIYRRINATFPDWKWTDIDIIADNDRVAFSAIMKGTHQASELPFLHGVPPTGLPVLWRHNHIFRLTADRIAEHWATRDDLDVLRQLNTR